MKIELTKEQIGNLMNQLDIVALSESEWADERAMGVKIQRIYNKLHKAYNQ